MGSPESTDFVARPPGIDALAERSPGFVWRTVEALPVQQGLAEPAWASRLGAEDRRGLTALFWSNVNPYGTFRLDMSKRIDLGPAAALPRPRAPANAGVRPGAETR